MNRLWKLLAALVLIAAPAVNAQDVNLLTPIVVPEIRQEGIQPGDRITLTVYNQNGQRLNDIGGERTVDRRGLIYLPFLENVDVRGMQQDELRDILDERYEVFYANSVVEVVVEYHVSVTGAVRSPGSYYLHQTATLSDALAEAGGPVSELDIGLEGGAADPTRVQLTRRGYTAPLTLNMRAIDADSSIVHAPIQSGDWLFVPPATRSQTREDIIFYGQIVSLLLGITSLIVLIANNSGG